MDAYKVLPGQLPILDNIVGQVGGPIPTEVSNALAAMQTAQAAGDGNAYNKAFNDAVAANQKNGNAWAAVQRWHDQVETQVLAPPTGGDPDPGSILDENGWTQYPPNIPPGDVVVTPTQHASGGWDCGTIPVNGTRRAVVVHRYDWVFWKADADGDVASCSCDGVGIAYGVFDAPTDPGNEGYPNTAGVRPYHAGQYVCCKPLEGGYNATRAVLFDIIDYGTPGIGE